MQVTDGALDLQALSCATVRSDPWYHATYTGVFRPEVLDAPFPDEHFSFHAQRRLLEAMGKKGSDAWYQHNVRTRPLLELGASEPFEPDSLNPVWLKVAKDLTSPEFRDCISDVAQHDVRKLEMQAHFWEFREGSFFQAHVDKPHKVVTFLMYLTKNWAIENGGCLQILSSREPHCAAYTVPPIANNGVILKREPAAWHAVTKIPADSKRHRVLLQAWFWDRS
jgi:hypothetical protein